MLPRKQHPNDPGPFSISNPDNLGLILCLLEIALPIQPSMRIKQDQNEEDAYFQPILDQLHLLY